MLKRLIRTLGILAVLYAVFVVVMRVLFPLPDIAGRADVVAMARDATTPLGGLGTPPASAPPGASGIVPLADGVEALALRIALADVAERSIDAQYYIWHDDTSGMLLLDALERAARRGVRVRLLLDDNGVPGLDPYIAALEATPNFDIRLFNPATVRQPKALGYSFDFFRMNRRMHNKAMLVDGSVAIVGGRNIGDEYFKVGNGPFYIDLDVAAVGAIVPRTAAIFDDYWNSASVHAAKSIIPGDGDAEGLAARIASIKATEDAEVFTASAKTAMARAFDEAQQIEWTGVQVVADDPAKGAGAADDSQLMITRLGNVLGTVESRLDLVSAYFVPGPRGTAFFTDLASAGKQVNILTNALDTTDVLLVHSGYTKYRRELLESGTVLYELKLRGGSTQADTQLKPLGLSGASLHAKTFAVDNERVFIGSFNFDPRSARLNCEMGFLIDSSTLANQMHQAFDTHLARVTYQPQITPEGNLAWLEKTYGAPVLYQQEPGASWFQQVALTFIGLLPIEWML